MMKNVVMLFVISCSLYMVSCTSANGAKKDETKAPAGKLQIANVYFKGLLADSEPLDFGGDIEFKPGENPFPASAKGKYKIQQDQFPLVLQEMSGLFHVGETPNDNTLNLESRLIFFTLTNDGKNLLGVRMKMILTIYDGKTLALEKSYISESTMVYTPDKNGLPLLKDMNQIFYSGFRLGLNKIIGDKDNLNSLNI